MIGSLKHTDR